MAVLAPGLILGAWCRYYEFISSDNNFRKLGFFAWLYVVLAIVETLIVIKVSASQLLFSNGPGYRVL